MNKLSNYLLSFFAIFATILQPNFASAGNEKSSTDSIKGSAPFEDWSEERFAAYEDSLLRALYPEVRECHYPDSLIKNSNSGISPASVITGYTSNISNPILPNTAQIDKTKAVGEIEIKSGMTPTGAKTYEVPIKVFPGMNGFQPNISLVYNSQSSNSVVGYGWSISGISSITRGGKNLIYDGKCEGLMMDMSDSFFLDGIRLIKIETLSPSCIKYESEQGNILVNAHVSGSIAKYFQVFYPDGRVAEFGYSNDTENKLYYPLTYIFDIHNNRISYTYENNSNHYRITKIEYNGAHIDFYYKSRDDIIKNYIGGKWVFEDKLLENISCYGSQEYLHEYTLTHSLHDDVSFLDEIGFHVVEDYYNPLRFIYGEGAKVGGYRANYTHTNTQLLDWYESENPDMIKTVRGRFDYGNTDDGLIVLPNLNPYWHHYRHSTAFRHSQNRYDNKYTGSERIFLYTGLSEDFASPMPELTTGNGFIDIMCADLQGKQEESVIKINNNVQRISSGIADRVSFTVYRPNPYSGLQRAYNRSYNFPTAFMDADGGQSIHPKFYYTGDFDGDGKMEILAVSAHHPQNDSARPSICYLFDLENDKILFEKHVFPFYVSFTGTDITDPWEAANKSDKLIPLDADGDGKTDICLINGTGIHTYTFEKDSTGNLNLRLLASDTDTKKTLFEGRYLMAGEFNGDGLVDLLSSSVYGSTSSYNRWYIFYSKGNGTFSRTWYYGGSNRNDIREGFLLQDIDCDGRTDLIHYQNSYFFTTPCVNNGFEGQSHTMLINGTTLVPTDINSHNKFNRLIGLRKGVVTKYSFTKNKAREQLLTGMVNSLGLIEKNEYRSLCDSESENGVYAHNGGAVFPYINIREPMMVLARSETVYNNEVLGSCRYEYENAVFHRQGLGFRGFEKVYSYDTHGNRTIHTYDPYNDCLLKSVVSPIAEITNDYTIEVKPDGTKKILLTTKTEKDNLTGYSADWSYTYDQYGYTLSENVEFSDGITIKKDMSYGDSSDIDDAYSLGFVTDMTITTTRGDDQYVERLYFPEFEYRQPIAAVRYVNGNQLARTEYAYDSHGNVTHKMVRPIDTSKGLYYTYTYTPDGLLSGETDPWGGALSYTYDACGRVSGIQDHTGTTSVSYDPFGREVSRSFPDNTVRVTTYGWSPDGSPGVYTVTTGETGEATVSQSFDALGRTVRTCDTRFDGKIRKIDKTYDMHGNLARESRPLTGPAASQWTDYEYDSHDRLLSVSEPSGRYTHYSYNGAETVTSEDGVDIRRKYDSQGNLILSSDAAGDVTYNLAADGQPVTVICPGGIYYWFYYDQYRRQDFVIDASAGIIRYRYDTWGNVNWRGAYGKDISYEYDDLNRLKKVVTPEFTTSYAYDGYSRLTSVSSDNGTSRTMTYDAYGREASRLEKAVDGVWLRKDFTYADGNISSIRYTTQSGLQLTEQHTYSQGTLAEGKVNGALAFKLNEEDADGLPTKIQTGSVTREYSFSHGLPEKRRAKCANNSYALDHCYHFDTSTSNLTEREDLGNGWYEDFSYDNLNRLTSDGERDFYFNSWGNITGRSDIGSFEYEIPNKPHAITKVIPLSGRMPLRTQEIAYTSFSRPDSISENGVKASFTYNGFSDRVRMHVARGNSLILDRYYLGECYERDVRDSSPLEKIYLFGDYYDAPMVYVYAEQDGEGALYHILRDYLGSVTHVLDSDGNTLQEMSYDAWGSLRDPETLGYFADTPDGDPELLLGRGYTGHEHLPWFGLINMNARLYDPLTGRFLSPDPFVQMPDFTQGLNRFSYALNNPFKYVDQDGEFFWAAVGIAALISGAVNVATHWNEIKVNGFWSGAKYFVTGAVAGGVGAAVGIGAAVGFGSMLSVTAASFTAATTGFIKGAIVGAASGAASGFVLDTGNSLIGGNNLGNALLNGLKGAGSGALSGAVIGGVAGGHRALKEGVNFWTGSTPDPNKHFVGYYGINRETGEVQYVGMTGRDPEIRFTEHLKSGTNRASLKYVPMKHNMTKIEARIWEQIQINKYGMEKNGGLLFNLRNEISPKYWNKYCIKFPQPKINYNFNVFNKFGIKVKIWQNELLLK